jgi:hypothetical protein
MISILPNSRPLWRDSRALASGGFLSSLILIGLFGCIQDSAKPSASKWTRVANNLSLSSGPVFLFARGDSLLALSGAKRGPAGLAVSVSGDGKAWAVHPQAASGPVFVTNAAAYRDTLWAIGPDSEAAANKSDTGSRSSLWKSRDGAHWAEVLRFAPFGDRDDAGFLATENGLWVVSGKSRNAAPFVFPGTWHSEDGNAWSDVGLEENPFATASSAIGLGNRIFVIGGGNQTDSSANLNIRSSADGIVWNANAPAAGLLPRWNPCLAEHAGKLWVIGGDSSLASSPGKGLSDVWSSVNGWQWILEDAKAPFAANTDRSAVSWRGSLWVVTAPDAPGADAGIWSLSPEPISP